MIQKLKLNNPRHLQPLKPSNLQVNQLKHILNDLAQCFSTFKSHISKMNEQTQKHMKIEQRYRTQDNILVSKLLDENKEEMIDHTEQNNEREKGNMRQVVEYYNEILQEIKQLKQSNNNVQARFKNIDIPLPTLPKQDDEKRLDVVLNWIGQVCRKVFSIGFNLYENGTLPLNQIKAYCSQNLLRNIIKLSSKHGFNAEYLKNINKCLVKEILPYFRYKYPQTEEKGINKKFQTQLIERDSIEDNEIDQIFRSKIEFKLNQNGNYNSQIMSFLNYILTLPEQKVHSHKESLYDIFYTDMQNFFTQIQTEETVEKMMEFNPKNVTIKKIENSQPKNQKNFFISEQEKEKLEQYKQKVKSYSHYEIGRKLGNNIPKFEKNQVQMGTLNLINSSIMRVAAKWCEELKKYYLNDYVVNREFPFRMKDGSVKYLRRTSLLALNELLKREWEEIERKLKQIQANNYEIQSKFINQKPDFSLIKLSHDEALVGQFSFALFKTNQNYLINYLNLLIHGINKATQHFETLLTRKLLQLPQTIVGINSQIEEIYSKNSHWDKEESEANKEAKNQDEFKILSQIPQLITFKIGDLLRCKCASKQCQIIALYREIERINKVQPELLKIVRVKNRLDKGNKDILINLMYRNILLIEMQLAIKSDKSKFIENSNRFSHYFYELQRAEFGPIMELCNIWISQDSRANFYLQKMQELNIRKPIQLTQAQQTKCCFNYEYQKIITLPFSCSKCSCFYYNSTFSQKHIICNQCFSNICFLCQLESANSQQKVQLLPQLKLNQQIIPESIKFYRNQLPKKGGVLINIRSIEKKPIIFRSILYNKIYYLFDLTNFNEKSPKLQLLKTFKNEALNQKQLKSILIFSSPQIQQIIPNLTQQDALDYYILPQLFQSSYKKQSKSISVANKWLHQNVYKHQTYVWEAAQHLNLSENKISSIESLPVQFPNIELGLLQFNSIVEVGGNCKNWKHLKILYLNNNLIENIDSLVELQNLTLLQLSYNKIAQLPQHIPQLKNLTKLFLSDNSLQLLPESFYALTSLVQLNLNNNKLTELSESLENLSLLQIIELQKNKLTSLPKSIKQLIHLKSLNLEQNLLKEIPIFSTNNTLTNPILTSNQIQTVHESIGNFTKLKVLDISQNSDITSLPQTFGNLKELFNLKITKCNLRSLPQSVVNLSSLVLFECNENKIQNLPESFGSLLSLKVLDLSINLLTGLPQSFGNLKNLTKCSLSNNRIQSLPQSFINLTSLTELSLQSNQLTSLPKEFDNLSSLVTLLLSSNKLIQLPNSMSKLKNLQTLNLNSNYFKQFSQEICGMNSLIDLSIGNNEISQLPQNFGKLLKLMNLYLNKNQLTQLPSSFCQLEKLKKLFLEENQIQSLPQHFGNLKSLTELNLSQNKLTNLPQSVGNLYFLWKLNLKSNKLFGLPETLGFLRGLKELYLEDNQLKSLPQSIGKLSALQKLSVNKNFLTTFPFSFANLISLNELDISQNPLTNIPPYFGNVSSLRKLKIDEKHRAAIRELKHMKRLFNLQEHMVTYK